MPILQFHLAEEQYTDAQVSELLLESSKFYAQVLGSPLDRVRVFAQFYKPAHVAVGGRLISDGAPSAPHFQFLVLEGRPVDECHRLLSGFTDLVVNILHTQRSLVRGGCWPIPPQFWSIGGTPASVLRAQEISARAEAAKSP